MPVVLIADDEPHLRLLISTTLACDEYHIVQAADGDEAWALIQQYHPAVVLLDVEMPGRSGIQIARAIRADPALAETYVVLLTGKAQAADIAAGQDARVDQYLTKPFSPLQLMLILEQALERV